MSEAVPWFELSDAVPDAEPLELLLLLSAVPGPDALPFALSSMLGCKPSVVWLESVTDTINLSKINSSRGLAHMTQSAVKSHNGPADRLQSVGGACR